MSENKPFASRYIETGAGTALAFAAVVRAVIAAVVFAITTSVPSSGSLLLGIAERTSQVSAGITAILDALMAIGLVLMRYKRKGCEIVYWALMLNFIFFVAMAVISAGNGTYINGNIDASTAPALIILLIFLANAAYYYACIKLMKVVRTELRQTGPVTEGVTNSVPVYCLIIIVVTVAYTILAYTTIGDVSNAISNVVNLSIYICLHMVAKDFDKEHKDITVPLGNSASADKQE